jgi:hypothetical protein
MRRKIGIGQRAIFLETEDGNVLWDCVPYIDDKFVEEVSFDFALGFPYLRCSFPILESDK